MYAEKGDERNALYAKIGRVRAEVDSMSFPEVSAYIGRLLESHIVQADPRLKLRCLTAKASIDILLMLCNRACAGIRQMCWKTLAGSRLPRVTGNWLAVRSQERSGTRGLYDVSGAQFASLPSTLKEVEEAVRIAGGRSVLLTGEHATEASFKAQPLSEFKVLHLALHGVANSTFPDRTALVFGPSPDSGEDGLLQAREIGRLHLSADLVTLSACNTGIGRLEGQEGVVNLVRAFLFAGARSVVASQWAADDVFTAALMKQFYLHLAEGLDKGTALSQAKLDLLRKHRGEIVPFYCYRSVSAPS